MLAEAPGGTRILAEPDLEGRCPTCHQQCIPKCGEIKTWHWAHKSLKDCDRWAEPEGEWHYGWKKLAGLENCEVTIRKPEGIHRADIKLPDGLVIELQHSTLPTADVRDRETFYGRMIWIIDGASVSSFAVERWISKDDKYYLKWGGKLKAWMNEIRRLKYFHFEQMAINTYYWQNYYVEYGTNISPQYSMPEPAYNPIKKWRKKCSSDHPIVLRDVLVKTNGEFCEIVSKADFVKKYFGRKQDSLFNF